MATKVETNPAELLKLAIPVGHWAFCADEQHPAAVAALAKVIGRESKQPSWQRRLAVTADGKTFLIVVDDCPRNPGSINWHDTMPEALRAIPVALPLELGVQLLQSDASPEKELERRRAQAKAREEAVAARHRAEIEASNLERDRLEREAQTRVQFKADVWPKLSPLQQVFARLALSLAERDPKIAADIRCALDAEASDFPKGTWWIGLDNTLESIRVAEVFSTMPGELRGLLKVKVGNVPRLVVAEYEAMRATNQKSRAA
jgi:hypothetical protein